jgi:tRNA (cytosine49-C5)-methyltransferase
VKETIYQLPKDFIERIQHYFPKHARVILSSYARASKTTFRLNAIKTDRRTLVRELKSAHILTDSVPWNPDAFVLKNMSLRDLQKKDIYKNGHIYVQNLSSMVPPLILDAREGERILDMCAAPGSKTTQMAAMSANKAEIVAIEKIQPRFYRLKANCALLGAQVKIICGDANRVAREYPDYFDKVLLDAPCSSEGLFNVHKPKSFAYWSRRKVNEMRHKQKRLIMAAWIALKPGGTLIYSTCTFSPQENEDVLHFFLKRAGEAADIQSITLPFKNRIAGFTQIDERVLDARLSRAVHILPSAEMEGFFIAKLVKAR